MIDQHVLAYDELEQLVEEWAEEKGILSRATPMAQAHKTLEESLELAEAIRKNDKPEIEDALGDTLVTLIVGAKMQGVDLTECLLKAYDVISKREGRMIGGQFVKNTNT